MLANETHRSCVLERILTLADGAPDLSPRQEGLLAQLAADGDLEALEALTTANLGRVVGVAREYRNMGLPVEDLVHEGVLGLLEAAPRFDASRGVRFFTYAAFLVRRNIVQALARGAKAIRVPRGLSARVRRFREAREHLSAGAGAPVTTEDTGRFLGLSAREARACADFVSPFEVSVDAPVSDDGGSLRSDSLPAAADAAPDALFAADEEVGELHLALRELPERERRILEARYGLGGEPARTLREVSASMNLSKERVRQLEHRARTVLRDRLDLRRHPRQPAQPA